MGEDGCSGGGMRGGELCTCSRRAEAREAVSSALSFFVRYGCTSRCRHRNTVNSVDAMYICDGHSDEGREETDQGVSHRAALQHVSTSEGATKGWF